MKEECYDKQTNEPYVSISCIEPISQKDTSYYLSVLCIQTHKLPLSYNFHNYMVRSMEDEFYEIVGIRYKFPFRS